MERNTIVQVGTGSMDDPIVLSGDEDLNPIVLSSDEDLNPEKTRSQQKGQVVCDAAPSVNHEVINRERMPVVLPSDCDQSFNKFVATCFSLDSSLTMLKVVKLKVKKHYSRLIPEYRRSEEFRKLIEKTEAEIVRRPDHLYRNLKYFIDEMKSHRSQTSVGNEEKPIEVDVQKLHTALKSLHLQIKALERKEVLWNDEGKSSYLKLQLYRKRIVEVYSKIQEIEGKSTSFFERKISFSGTQFPSVNKAIERYYNTLKEFPCYNEIFEMLKLTYKNEGIKMPTDKLHSEAKSIFTNLGDKLQKRRQFECWEAHSAYLDGSSDPAEKDMKLRSALEENRTVYGSRIDDIIDTFARAGNSPGQKSPKKKSNELVIESQENSPSRRHCTTKLDEGREQDSKHHNSEQRNAVGDEYRGRRYEIIQEGVGGCYVVYELPTELSDYEAGADYSPRSRPLDSTTTTASSQGYSEEFSGYSETEEETRPGCSAWSDVRRVDPSLLRKLHIFKNRIRPQCPVQEERKLCLSDDDKEPEIVILD